MRTLTARLGGGVYVNVIVRFDSLWRACRDLFIFLYIHVGNCCSKLFSNQNIDQNQYDQRCIC